MSLKARSSSPASPRRTTRTIRSRHVLRLLRPELFRVGPGQSSHDNYLLQTDPPQSAKDPVFTAGAVGQLTQTRSPATSRYRLRRQESEQSVDGSGHTNRQRDAQFASASERLVRLHRLDDDHRCAGQLQILQSTTRHLQGRRGPARRLFQRWRADRHGERSCRRHHSGRQQSNHIVLLGGDHSIHNNFGETLPSSISGMVHADINGDCTYQQGEPLLSGVQIDLYDGITHLSPRH